MVNVVAALVLLLIVGAAAGYVYKAKKKGHKCVGCPYAKECASRAKGCGCTNE